MYGIDEHGVWFAKQVPTDDQITVSVVNKAETNRVQRQFANTAEGEAEAVAWSLNADFTDTRYAVSLAAAEATTAFSL